MLGYLPTSLEVNGKEYQIDADFRNILQIFLAFEDDELEDKEKAYICISRLYEDYTSIPKSDLQDAFTAALDFLNYGNKKDEKETGRHKLMDWEDDETILFPAINKAAGCEVRALPFLHWWTFLGYFQSIDSESLLGTVLSIRQKKSKGKKLEKWEREFEKNNRELCALKQRKKYETPEDSMAAWFKELIAEGAVEDNG